MTHSSPAALAQDGEQGSIVRINVQPVIPISLNDNWNVISRTIVPIIDQNDIPTQGVSEFGLGDTVLWHFDYGSNPSDDARLAKKRGELQRSVSLSKKNEPLP